MIVCDRCKDVSKAASEVGVTVFKTEKTRKGLRNRKMINIPFALCEQCINILNRDIGRLKTAYLNGEVATNKVPLKEDSCPES